MERETNFPISTFLNLSQKLTELKMTTNSEPIYSSLASDPDYMDLVQEFVSEFPNKAQTIRGCISGKNLELLQRTMHQMRGACGGYGFPTLTESAGSVEEGLKAGQSLESLEARISEFLNMLQRATGDQA